MLQLFKYQLSNHQNRLYIMEMPAPCTAIQHTTKGRAQHWQQRFLWQGSTFPFSRTRLARKVGKPHCLPPAPLGGELQMPNQSHPVESKIYSRKKKRWVYLFTSQPPYQAYTPDAARKSTSKFCFLHQSEYHLLYFSKAQHNTGKTSLYTLHWHCCLLAATTPEKQD